MHNNTSNAMYIIRLPVGTCSSLLTELKVSLLAAMCILQVPCYFQEIFCFHISRFQLLNRLSTALYGIIHRKSIVEVCAVVTSRLLPILCVSWPLTNGMAGALCFLINNLHLITLHNHISQAPVVAGVVECRHLLGKVLDVTRGWQHVTKRRAAPAGGSTDKPAVSVSYWTTALKVTQPSLMSWSAASLC